MALPKVRLTDSQGDSRFGVPAGGGFVQNSAGVAQLVKNRLQLLLGSWFLDTSEGTEITPADIKARILDTNGVTEILEFNYSIDSEARKLNIYCRFKVGDEEVVI